MAKQKNINLINRQFVIDKTIDKYLNKKIALAGYTSSRSQVLRAIVYDYILREEKEEKEEKQIVFNDYIC